MKSKSQEQAGRGRSNADSWTYLYAAAWRTTSLIPPAPFFMDPGPKRSAFKEDYRDERKNS